MRITKSRLREMIAEELREGSYGDTAYDRGDGGENKQTPIEKLAGSDEIADLLRLKSRHKNDKGKWHVKELGTHVEWNFPQDEAGSDGFSRALSTWYRGTLPDKKPRSMMFIKREDLPPTAQ